MDDFKRINSEFKITIVANMHHVDLAMQYATRIIGIKEGVIVFDGPNKLVTPEILEMIYGRKLTKEDVLEAEPVELKNA